MIIAFAVMMLAGFIKGAIGFALPMIAISGIGTVMSAEIAIAAMILPGLFTNFWQSLRNGFGAALVSLRKFWRLNLILLVMIYYCAKLVTVVPESFLFLILGASITVFGTIQIVGWQPRFPPHMRNYVEAGVALVAGFFGGLAGVWGPPILMYLMALETPKVEQIRVQGISFLLGSIVLTVAHLNSGVLNQNSLPFSAALIVPAALGMFAGFAVQSRIDQQVFRKATLIVLVIAGLNLLRRGFFG
ncbi:MAG: sulfite exporter TauE/SafE family protein [Rhodobacteraceae bacterium]|nr:sulfite exporter TauE/SafE family protein [Paracoccaceae bacterium]